LQSVDFDLQFLRTTSLDAQEMRKRRRSQLELHQKIWWTWNQLYLPLLRRYHSERHVENPTPLVEGQFVLIGPDDQYKQSLARKMTWPRGIVRELSPWS